MDAKALLAVLPDVFKTTVYMPQVMRITTTEADGDFDKFGGIPSVEADFKHLQCRSCKCALKFCFQLTSPIDETTVQMFICVQDRKVCPYKGDETYLRYIDYTTHKMANYPAGERKEWMLKHTYTYPAENHNPSVVGAPPAPYGDRTYHFNWLNHLYGDRPYQCSGSRSTAGARRSVTRIDVMTCC